MEEPVTWTILLQANHTVTATETEIHQIRETLKQTLQQHNIQLTETRTIRTDMLNRYNQPQPPMGSTARRHVNDTWMVRHTNPKSTRRATWDP